MSTATKIHQTAAEATGTANPEATTQSASTAEKPTPEAAQTGQGASKPAPAPALIVFGLDKDLSPVAATFQQDQIGLATKAAELMQLRTLKVAGPELTALAQVLPTGRIYASGHGFVPVTRPRFYEQLDEIASRKVPPGLPADWDHIDLGQLVIAQEDGGWKEGWWEAIVLAKDGDMLTLKWRDFPKQANVVRHAASVALLRPMAILN